MNEYMRKAVKLALDNVLEGGQPFGAVLVKDGKIISEGVNELHKNHDISGHAEMIAIRKAQKEMQTGNLNGYTMYASGYPCAMCYTAMRFAGIKEIYYCASLEDAKEAGLGGSGKIYDDLTKPNAEREVSMKLMKLENDMEDPMRIWAERRNA